MAPLLDVSDEVRAEIGQEETDRLLAGENAPGTYDCTSCRTPGDTGQERTSTVLFVGDETAVLAFAHAACIPSQVVPVVVHVDVHPVGVVEARHQGRGAGRAGEVEHPEVDRPAGAEREADERDDDHRQGEAEHDDLPMREQPPELVA